MENKRKKRLLELKNEQSHDSKTESSQPDSLPDATSSRKTEGDDLNNFIKDVVARKKARKQQLEIVHDFFENPAAYGVDTDIIPSSTTTDEIDARKKELQHKIDLLHSVLKALEGEMQLLCQVKVSADNDSNTASSQQTILEKKAAEKKNAPQKKTPRNRSTAKKPSPK